MAVRILAYLRVPNRFKNSHYNQSNMELEVKNARLELSNMEHIMEFSKRLNKYIESNNLSSKIAGNDYVNVDGWKFAGLNFGLTAHVEAPVKEHVNGQKLTILYENREIYTKKGKEKRTLPYLVSVYADNDELEEQIKGNENHARKVIRDLYKFSCNAVIKKIGTDEILGTGSAICTNLEEAKIEFAEYAVQSMAQTRAIGKAYRNTIGFVMKSAGYEPTPLEEMEEERLRQKTYNDAKEVEDLDMLSDSIDQIETQAELKDFYNSLAEKTQKNSAVKALFSAKKIKLLSKQ